MNSYREFFETTSAGWIFASMFGLIWGSFFNVLIVRLPQEKTLLTRSQCPSCQALIPWFLNIPVASYVWLRGQCRQCRKHISIEYPIVEILTAILFGGLFKYYGLGLDFLSALVFLSNLLVISVIDLHHQIIPDELSLSGIVVGFLFTLVTHRIPWWHSLIGVAIGGGIFLLIAVGYEKMTKRVGLGGGDVKLLAMIGAWQGYQCLFPVIIISSALGSVIGLSFMAIQKKDLKAAIPFGPFLAVGAFVYQFWGEYLLELLFPSFQ